MAASSVTSESNKREPSFTLKAEPGTRWNQYYCEAVEMLAVSFMYTHTRCVIFLWVGRDSLGVEDGAEHGADDNLQFGDLHGGKVGKVLLKRPRFLQIKISTKVQKCNATCFERLLLCAIELGLSVGTPIQRPWFPISLKQKLLYSSLPPERT